MTQDAKESILAVVGMALFMWANWSYAIHTHAKVGVLPPLNNGYQTGKDKGTGKTEGEIFGYHPEKFKGPYKYGVWYPITKKGPGHE